MIPEIKKIYRIYFPPEITSQFGEQILINNTLAGINCESNFIIDLGASDGITASNTYYLFRKGYPGIAIEPDSSKFFFLAWTHKTFRGRGNFRTTALNCFINPENVFRIFQLWGVPEKPMFLNLDIDGYDYFVLDKILEKYRPSLICCEINEKIPPPIIFKVKYSPEFRYCGDHFYGMSISALGEICGKYDYSIITLNYNNALIVPRERASSFGGMTPALAYELGYLGRPDRKEKFPWNADLENLLKDNFSSEKRIGILKEYFRKYEGQYEIDR